MGNWARVRPSAVRRCRPSFAGWRAPSSVRSATPSLTWRRSGPSTNGNSSTSPRPSAAICRMTEARLVRRISGSVNSGRERKSSSEYSRMQMPSATRPQRPLRWLAEACEIRSIGRRCTLVRWLYREIRAVPGSTTYRIPGTVSEVSATLVARTIAPSAARLEHALLFGCGQPRIQRQDLRPAALRGTRAVFQRLRGVADLAFPAQEDEDVAGAFSAEFVHGVADALVWSRSSVAATVSSSSTTCSAVSGRYRTSTG